MLNPKRVTSRFLSATALMSALAMQNAHAIDLTASAGSTLTYYNQSVVIDPDFVLTHDDPTINGFRVAISNPSTGDALSFSNQLGITGSYDATNFVLRLSGSGTIADYQTAIRSITLSTTNTLSGDRTISFSIDSDDVATLYNSFNGHFYQFRTTYPTGGVGAYDSGGTVDCSGSGFSTGSRTADDGISWKESKSAAAQFSYFGWTGYLATITDEEENDFLFAQINNKNAWIGASDDPSETVNGIQGNWEWITGPEAGTLFWSEVDGSLFNSRPATGSAQNGQYSNWRITGGSEEPNNYQDGSSPVDGESYAHFFSDQAGAWNDMPNIEGFYKSCGYLVEFGGMPGDSATLAAEKVVNVTATNQAPTAANATVTGAEDSSYTFSEANFGFSDADGVNARLDHITIKTLPGLGTLKLSGTDVSINDSINKDDIANLVFNPVANGNGAAYTSFTFSVNDGFEDSASDYTLTIDVTADNDTPSMSVTLGAAIVENSATDGTVVASFTSTDPDGTPSVDFTAGSNTNGYYEIVGTNVELTQAGADFVNAGGTLPALSLTATDDTNGALTSADSKVPVVTATNDTPTLTLTLGADIAEESASNATVVASFVAADEEGTPTVGFSAGTNSDGYYEIVGTNVELTQAGADFVVGGGTLPALSLTATDDTNGALTAVDAATPVIISSNDTPTLSLTLGAAIVEGSASDSTVVASFVAADEESTPTVDFSAGTNADGYYEIVGTNVELTQAGADFVNGGGTLPAISLTVTDTSDGALTAVEAKTPVVTSSNDTPTLTLTLAAAIVEDSATDATVVANFVAADEEGTPAVDFTAGSNSNGYYEIVGTTVELTQVGADFVNGGGTLPALSLTATDDSDGSLTVVEAATPVITSTNDIPSLVLNLGSTIVEGSANNSTVVASFVASDEDGTPVVDFTAGSNSNAYYEIVGTNIELTQVGADFVNAGGTLPALSLTATDDSNNAVTAVEAKTPVIASSNDVPTLTVTLGSAIVEDSATDATVVASFVASDEEGTPSVGFTPGSNSNGYYEIVGTTVELTQIGADFVNGGGTLPALSLTATDDSNTALTAVDAVTPVITATNDTPTLTLTLGAAIVEGSASNSTIVASFVASDEEGTPSVDFTAGSNSNGYYEIVGSNVELTQAGADFVNGGGTLPALSLTVTDSSDGTLTVADAKTPVTSTSNDVPILTVTLATAIVENEATDATVVATFAATDEEGTPSVSFTPGTNSAGYFEIVGSNVELTQAGADFVNGGGTLPSLSLTATDDSDGTLTAITAVLPIVTATNDTPSFSVSLGAAIAEGGASNATVVATFVVSDEEGTPTVSFTAGSNSEGYYEIVDATVELTQAGADFVNGGGTLPALSLTATDDSDSALNVLAAITPVITSNTDKDGDGIPNNVEGTGDADGDGIPNDEDSDSDNDGISDQDEGLTDSDGDGTPDYLDSSQDEDADGIPDIVEGTADTDGDGIPNFKDTDSDNDGLPDSVEAAVSGVDTDNDGIDDLFDMDQTNGTDLDGDGVDDSVELLDSDNDGIPDYIDTDSDNDGIPDSVEIAISRSDSNDNTIKDNDADGKPNHLDSDSDNDGISDFAEGNASGVDSDNDGIDDTFDVDSTGGVDANLDGVDDDVTVPDTDGDGVPDLHDLDSDNDGLFDTTEAGVSDDDRNGIADNSNTLIINPVDTDSDGTPDYRDLDSDNDGTFDIEGTAAVVLDTDNNGQIDITNDTDGDGIDDLWDEQPDTIGSSPDLDNDGIADSSDPDIDGDGIDNIIEGSSDQDGDGIANDRDLDSDNDGIPDSVEGAGNHDNDDLPDFLDLDSDNDGISDRAEALASANNNNDSDGDTIPDYYDRDSDNDGLSDSFESGRPAASGIDTDNDGIDDSYDVDSTGGADADQDGINDSFVAADSDNDGIPNYLDSDSDNDGISDAEEQILVALKHIDSDGDGIDDAVDVDMTGGIDANGDGIDDALIRTTDTDGDGLYEYLDLDSDGDGFSDAIENADFNNDGINDSQQFDTGRVKTGVRGGGAMNPLSVLLFLSFALFRSRFRAMFMGQKKKGLGITLITLATFITINVQAEDDIVRKRCIPGVSWAQAHCWYVGAGLSFTQLNPEPLGDTLWRVDDSSSNGFKLLAGLSLGEHWFTELTYENLGSAGLKHLNPNVTPNTDSVSYYSLAASGGYWLRGISKDLDFYVKAGLATLGTNNEDAYVYQDHPNQYIFGAGAEWRISKKWSSRVEVTSYDRDASSVNLTATMHIGSRSTVRINKKRQIAAVATPPLPSPTVLPPPSKATPAVKAIPVVKAIPEKKTAAKKPPQVFKNKVVIQPAKVAEPLVVQPQIEAIAILEPDEDEDGISDRLDECALTPEGSEVDSRGCSLLRTVNLNIQFETNRAIISTDSLLEIDEVIDAIHILGNVHVTVEGHTDWKGKQADNQPLSELRAAVVADLIRQETRLKKENFTIIGYGELKPIADNTTEEGRYKNRRVVIIISQQ